MNRHTLYHLYDPVRYYRGETPPIIGHLDHGTAEDLNSVLGMMRLWFNKRARFGGEREFRYAYVIESPELETLPEHMDLDLTVRATRMLEPL